MNGRPLSAKLFLEGMEVPFIGATITHTGNMASIAYIDLVPHSTINNIQPRTMVQIMVRDINATSTSFPYVLAWEGEVFGFSFGKTPSSRSFTISCIDYSSYWDNVLAYFFNAQQTLGKGTAELIQVALDTLDANKQNFKQINYTTPVNNYFLQTVKAGIKAAGANGDFLNGFVNVFQSIGNVNAFYALAANRLNINARILLQSSGALTELLQQDAALQWFAGIVGKGSGFATLRSVVQDLLSIIFHDFVSMPFPSTVNGNIGQFVFKPNLYMMPPPMCNVFYPDEYSSFNYSRNFLQEPTRLIYKPEMPTLNSGAPVALLHVYQPPSFASYMANTTPTASMIGSADVQIPASQGYFGKSITNVASSNISREGQFLTNEESLKGILMAQESMVPATSQFRASLTNYGRISFASQVAKYLFYKRRFQSRQVQITSHLKLSVVPGFTTLILDDSDAQQSVIAYCESVTHRIYATQGGYTNTTMSYARTVTEQDQTSGLANDPLVPPWFAKSIFGTSANGTTTVPDAISTFYANLLGTKASNCITTQTKTQTMVLAATALAATYRAQKKAGVSAVQSLIDQNTSRNYTSMQAAFAFLGASSPAKNYNVPWLQFTGARISGNSGQADDTQVNLRRAVIIEYRNALKTNRGFRG